MLATFKQFYRFFKTLFSLFGKLFSSDGEGGNGGRGGRRRVDVETDSRQFPTNPQSARENTGWFASFEKAQRSRRAGDYERAETLFKKVLKEGEASSDWKMFAPPRHYGNLAELLYHRGRDQEALDVIERFETFQQRHGNDSNSLDQLKRGIESGGKRRLSHLD